MMMNNVGNPEIVTVPRIIILPVIFPDSAEPLRHCPPLFREGVRNSRSELLHPEKGQTDPSLEEIFHAFAFPMDRQK
jgi:hypothetical protein